MGNAKISVLILTQNSDQTLTRTLESVKNFDEIVVIDGGSIDRTKEIAHSYMARFVPHPFKGFSRQRNIAIDEATHEWCLMLDSDEAITPELAEELYRVASNPGAKPLYRIYRTEYILGEEIKFGHGRSGPQERFFKKSEIRYTGEVHEYPLIRGRRPDSHENLIGELSPDLRILHNPDYTVTEIVSKVGRYSILKAKEKIAAGRRTNAFMVFISFPLSFIQIYLKGLRAGRRGFIAAILEAAHRCFVKLLIYENQIIEKEKKITRDQGQL